MACMLQCDLPMAANAVLSLYRIVIPWALLKSPKSWFWMKQRGKYYNIYVYDEIQTVHSSASALICLICQTFILLVLAGLRASSVWLCKWLYHFVYNYVALPSIPIFAYFLSPFPFNHLISHLPLPPPPSSLSNALDAESEHLVQQALDRVPQGGRSLSLLIAWVLYYEM